MPTYDYECQKCGHIFEAFQAMSDERLTTCPECGGLLKRLLGAGAGLIFKGSGFYTTDYRSSDYTAKSKSDVPTPPETSAAATTPATPTAAGDAGGGAKPAAATPKAPSGPPTAGRKGRKKSGAD